MELLKKHLTLFFVFNPKYILENDTSKIIQRSSEFIRNYANEEELNQISEINLPEKEYKNILYNSGWFGQLKLPRYKMKEKILKHLLKTSETFKSLTNSGEIYLLHSLLTNDFREKKNSADKDEGFTKTPEKYDYNGWIEKKEKLKIRIAFGKYLMFLHSKKILQIKNTKPNNDNYIMALYKNLLELHFSLGYKAKEKVEQLLNKPINEYQEELMLEDLIEAMEIELSKTQNHISWLEEEITSPAQIHQQSHKKVSKKNGKISTRKLAIKN